MDAAAGIVESVQAYLARTDGDPAPPETTEPALEEWTTPQPSRRRRPSRAGRQ